MGVVAGLGFGKAHTRMKTPFTPGLLFLLALAAPLPAATIKEPAAPAKERPAQPKPTLTLDGSPVTDGQPAVLTSYADILEPVQKAVVSVYATKFIHERQSANPLIRPFSDDPNPARESKEQGLGSGVIVSPNGYLLTNNHVIEGADELSVALPDNREYRARLVGADPKTDIAILKIDAENLPSLPLADSDKLRVGDIVFAVGNPLGIGQTVTMGIVSAKGRNNLGLLENVHGYEDFIQTDAAINMGNSGGALVDAKGRLVGINSAIVSTTRGNIGIGLAIPVNLAASIMNSLIETGSVTRGYLGISVGPINPALAETLGLKKETRAVTITQVNPGSPAEKAGLQRSDVLLSINDKAIASIEDLRLLVAKLPPETEVTAKILRNGGELALKARLGRLTDDNTVNEFLPGVEATRLTDELRRRLNLGNRLDGLVITSVEPKSPNADRLAPGMVILEINRQPANDPDTARRLLQPGRNLFFIYNRGYLRYLIVTK